MSPRAPRLGRYGRRHFLLAGFLLLQSIATIFFLGDAIADIAAHAFNAHMIIETIIAFVLVAGVVLGALEMRGMLERAERDEAALAAASGALGELIEAAFVDWGLTAAEAEVALFTLKGFDVAEIAGYRNAAAGTVRAQLTRIYAKAGVSSRAQFVSLFIEDLLAQPLSRSPTAAAAPDI